MNIDVQIAGPEDMESLWVLNHEVYCLELGQHHPEASGTKVDRMHRDGVFFMAKSGDLVVGMLSITLPGRGAMSTLARMRTEDLSRCELNNVAEIRLLAVEKAYRGKGVYDALMMAVMRYCTDEEIHSVVISAIGRQQRLYALMGFKPISTPVFEGDCQIQPMLLTRQDFEDSIYRRGRLALMEAR